MAEAFMRSMAADRFDSYSAGSKPGKAINPVVAEAMKEKGIDISANKPKGFGDLPLKDFDVLVTMGCGDTCPFYPSAKQISWNIDDPKGKSIDEVRGIRDAIRSRAEELLRDIDK